MQQALDTMEAAIKAGDWKVDGACDPDYVLEALRARLAEPEPTMEIAWIDNKQTGNFFNVAPPQREWKGLTDYEMCGLTIEMRGFAKHIEAKLKEKNT
jgi:hypothetical protein